MKKTKIKIEYPLSNASLAVLWNCIGTANGLSEWFADEVIADGDEFTFKWINNVQKAHLLHSKPNSYIRLQWEDDRGTDAFFEIRIISPELTRELALQITDFADSSESDDLILLWNKQIDDLKRVSGID
jgi:hypothetical protein